MSNKFSCFSFSAYKFLLALLCFALLAPAPLAQRATARAQVSSAESDRAELHQALLDLTNPLTVMCVAAHPDDEDGATLTLLRRKYGVHTASLFSTYGEGGQNAMGPELYEELGAIRARETEAAAKIQGSEPHFLALRDFGFSKSADEAFRVWGHDEALRRMVLKIRMLEPDVIITNHDTSSGHGHHQATGRLVLEAFDAAADSARFPEQLHDYGIPTWQVKRLFVRINYEGGAGSRNLEEEAERNGKVVSVNVNERDPVRDSTYAEQALQALHQHASQGPWPDTVPAAMLNIRYRLAREATHVPPLPSHAQTFLDGLQLPPAVAAWLDMLKIDGRPLYDFVNEGDRVFSQLIAAYRDRGRLQSLGVEDNQRFVLMSVRLSQSLALASGIEITLSSPETTLVPGSTQPVTINFRNTGTHQAIVRGQEGEEVRLAPGNSSSLQKYVNIPASMRSNLPLYEHLYDGYSAGLEVRKYFQVTVDNNPRFAMSPFILFDVAPPVEIASVSPSLLVLTPTTLMHPGSLRVQLINHLKTATTGRLTVLAYISDLDRRKFEIEFRLSANESRAFEIPDNDLSRLMRNLHASGSPFTGKLTFSISSTNRAAGREQTVQRAIPIKLIYATVAPHLRVGYIRSFDYTLSSALNALGVENRELTVDEVRAGDLSKFDTIIIDNRGYQFHPELIAANARLLDFVRSGGTLIVFYHKANEWNPDAQSNRPQLAPYPITLGSLRVTDESAPVTFTEPGNALLNFPNKISQEDFQGWTQERGLYFPREWDEHYSAPLAMNDANEPSLRGGLLAADYGRGRYIYTSIVWYRQLRAGNTGAYRVFSNMISYGRVRASSQQ
ncbi:MAG TPA: PIG-L family deacetylase [Pyrinomonadaceae bacterium]|nr:PIG-L family deacetylase [Pyrinomonadaceae bacterium]